MGKSAWVIVAALLLAASSHAQTVSSAALPAAAEVSSSVEQGSSLLPRQETKSSTPSLPEAPAPQPQTTTGKLGTCPTSVVTANPGAQATTEAQAPCAVAPLNPYKRFLDNGKPIPLSPRQKAYLALHDIIDPFNLLTIAANSAFTVGIDAHNPNGPGMKGFGKSMGYSFSQDATGEVIGTFGICSLFHEDPHYHRLPSGTPFARVVHAISRTVIAQHDDGRMMPNYEVLLTYPASAEISNLYVPGIHGNGPSTVARIFTGFATDPINNLITEFLPDFARRFHVRVVFLQQIINQVASGGEGI